MMASVPLLPIIRVRPGLWKDILSRCEPYKDCLLYTGRETPNGYGVHAVMLFGHNGKKTSIYVHRLAWVMKHNQEIPEGAMVVRKLDSGCTSRRCCNADHWTIKIADNQGWVNGKRWNQQPTKPGNYDELQMRTPAEIARSEFAQKGMRARWSKAGAREEAARLIRERIERGEFKVGQSKEEIAALREDGKKAEATKKQAEIAQIDAATAKKHEKAMKMMMQGHTFKHAGKVSGLKPAVVKQLWVQLFEDAE